MPGDNIQTDRQVNTERHTDIYFILYKSYEINVETQSVIIIKSLLASHGQFFWRMGGSKTVIYLTLIHEQPYISCEHSESNSVGLSLYIYTYT